jgi:uncharacterized membrane protein
MSSIPDRNASSSRVHLVDLLRLVALLQMVNGHTLDAVVSESIRHGHAFDVYNFFRGLVSVAFMLASGVAFHLTTISRLDRTPRSEPLPGTAKRVRRMLEIIAIGYLLRFPLGAWSDDPVVVEGSWNRLAEIDVLQCIGVSLLSLEALAHALRDRRRTEIGAGVMALVVIALAPLTEGVVAERPLSFVTGWLSHSSGSIFPFFPWSAYVFLGAVLGAVAFPEGGRTPWRKSFVALSAGAVAASAATWALWRAPFTLWEAEMSYHSMPAFFVEKLAWVLGALAVLAPVVSRIRALPGPIATLAGETLAVYVFHLLVLFFPPMMLAARVGHHLTLPEGLAISAAMIVACSAFGVAWPRLWSLGQHAAARAMQRPGRAPAQGAGGGAAAVSAATSGKSGWSA